MPLTLLVPEGYGYVVLLSLGLTPLLAVYHGSVVSKLRPGAKTPYPNCYATAEEMRVNPAAEQFNCAQRAHAQFNENMPLAVMTMLVGGLGYPTATAVMSAGWLVSRLLYMIGYVYQSKGTAGKGRRLGATFWLFQGGLWGVCAATALKML